MKLHFDSNLQEFSQNTKMFFETDKRLHSMILGLVRRYLEIEKPMSILARLENDQGDVVAAGIQTEADRTLIIGKLSPEIAREFARQVAESVASLPGVNGPMPTVKVFADEWATLKNKNVKVCTNLRLFELKELIPPKAPKGSARLAEPKDRDLIFQWLEKFHEEAIPHDPKPKAEDLSRGIDLSIELKRYFLWEDGGKVVSFVGSARETDDEKWIAPVYTPKEFRGRGYGSALTAYASQKILDIGKVGMLFTDQANPVSNGIYQKMGYKPLGDFAHLGFE